MKTRFVIPLLLTAAWLPGAVEQTEVDQRLRRMPATHPRLFLTGGGEQDLVRSMTADPVRTRLRASLLSRADAILAEPPVARVLIGRRLLDKSRLCLSRVTHLGMAWRLTGERKYAERARREMLAAAAFSDWNPSHFLDVAEMTAALGIGYDWFHAFLDESERRTIREAIVTKGLRQSLVTDSWSKATHNWNQVCNGGLAVGALAVAESEPELAGRIIARAVNTVPLAMHEYGPDGAYPEGASYWGYGTTYNVILIAALQSALGEDFGLSQQPGFLATADYYLHVFGPTGLPFSYSDASPRTAGSAAAMYWFAATRKEPYLLWSEWQKLEGPPEGALRGDRVDPLLPLWMAPGTKRPPAPSVVSWTGHGITPVAFHRTGWDTNAVYVAVKGGSPATNHAHMDVGSFVMDADGARWADDLGLQEYNSLESKGINLWARGQDAERWKVFRLSTAAHGVLMVNGADQRVDGQARMTLSKAGRTIVDMGETYRGQLGAARRGVQLRPDRTVLIQDELTAPKGEAASLRWAMVTRAEVKVNGPGSATLTRDGKTLVFRVLEPAEAELKIYSTDPPPAATDAPNPGTRILGFEVKVPAGGERRLRVQLVPQSAKPSTVVRQPLSEW